MTMLRSVSGPELYFCLRFGGLDTTLYGNPGARVALDEEAQPWH